MKTVNSVGIGLSLITASLLLALVAEIYYLFWWKKRRSNNIVATTTTSSSNISSCSSSSAKELLYMFCWKRPPLLSSLSSSNAAQDQLATAHDSGDDVQLQIPSNSTKDFVFKSYGSEEMSIEAELMRLHSLAGPPRFLFTIKEETKEDLEREDGNRKRGKSLSEFLLSAETPPRRITPLSSPKVVFTPPSIYKQSEFNPLFNLSSREDEEMEFDKILTSPPPKMKFLRDAEEKLYLRTLKEEADKVGKSIGHHNLSSSPKCNEESSDGSFITIVIGKSRDHRAHSGSSQVIPLHSSPLSFITASTNIANTTTTSPLTVKASCKE